jgi:hypothetical protein
MGRMLAVRVAPPLLVVLVGAAVAREGLADAVDSSALYRAIRTTAPAYYGPGYAAEDIDRAAPFDMRTREGGMNQTIGGSRAVAGPSVLGNSDRSQTSSNLGRREDHPEDPLGGLLAGLLEDPLEGLSGDRLVGRLVGQLEGLLGDHHAGRRVNL